MTAALCHDRFDAVLGMRRGARGRAEPLLPWLRERSSNLLVLALGPAEALTALGMTLAVEYAEQSRMALYISGVTPASLGRRPTLPAGPSNRKRQDNYRFAHDQRRQPWDCVSKYAGAWTELVVWDPRRHVDHEDARAVVAAARELSPMAAVLVLAPSCDDTCHELVGETYRMTGGEREQAFTVTPDGPGRRRTMELDESAGKLSLVS